MVDPLLRELQRNGRIKAEELAKLFNISVKDVQNRIKGWEADGTILGYQAVVDPDRAGSTHVTAHIEVRLTPERDGGFDRIARRIAKFDQVTSCFLMSGGFDLVVVVEAETLREVAQFVTEKLSTQEGVLSTSTHFQLKAYKQNGIVMAGESNKERLTVAP